MQKMNMASDDLKPIKLWQSNDEVLLESSIFATVLIK